MPVRFDYANLAASSRKNHEDRVVVVEHGDALVVAVADGAGGRAGGASAADAFVASVRATISDARSDVATPATPATWATAIVVLDRKLASALAGETTGVVVVVGRHGLLGASVGDSAAWVIEDDDIDDLTARQNRSRIGSGRAAPVTFVRPRRRGTIVVGTDGLFNYAPRGGIVEATRVGTPSENAERLRRLVQLRSGGYPDDVGIVVVGGLEAGVERRSLPRASSTSS